MWRHKVMEEFEKRTEKFKRKEPPDALFAFGSFYLLFELLPIEYRNNWTSLGIFLFTLFFLWRVIERIKGWYYTKWTLFILIYVLGLGLLIFKDIIR